VRQPVLARRRHSIRWRLPVAIGALVYIAMGGMAIFAFLEVRTAVTEVAATRLVQVTHQLQELLEAGVQQRYTTLDAVAKDTAIRNYLLSPRDSLSRAGIARLRAHLTTNAQVRSVELWDTAGTRLVTEGVALPPLAVNGARALMAEATSDSGGSTSPYQAVGDSVQFTIVVPVRRGDRVMAFVADRRRLTGTVQAARQLSELVGSGARLLVGNRAGDVWTDLTRAVDGPPNRVIADSSVVRYAQGSSEEVLAKFVPVRGTPWVVGVEFRAAPIVAPAMTFLWRALAAVLVLGLGATGVGILYSRSITRPLQQVTDAAGALAAGREVTRVPLERRDEIGRLAASFSTMAEEIARGHERLAAALEQYQLLFDKNPMPMWVYDRETLAFLQVNEAAVKHYGYSADEFRAMTLKDIRPPDEVGRLEDVMRAAPDPNTKRGVWKHRRKDGTFIDVEITRTNIMLQGRSVSFALANDITERSAAERALASTNEALRKSQEQLLHSQKMEALGRLAGGIAHDFNNITTAILGFAEFLSGALETNDPRREDAQEIQRAGLRAAELTKQLLAFSRQQVIEVRTLQLNEVVKHTERLLQRLLGEDIDLVTILAPDLGWVESDPGQVEQALVNLAVNARHAMPGGGKLTIETGSVVLDEHYAALHSDARPGPHIMLAVSDSGSGMTPEVASRVFEPFFTTKPRGQGTGLGLATVYGIVRQSGGHVAVYSELGRGTVFKLYFPEVKTDSAPAAPIVHAPATTEQRFGTVLLVEDEPAVRAIASRVLRQLGYRVLEAKTGSEALRLSEELGQDCPLVLTDVIMPEMSGPELAARLQERIPNARIVFMSGYTDDSIVRHGMLPKHAAFLQKPFTVEQLKTKIREVLDSME
jgi:two-component system cell cycle sensor histidine kinase/response regulator CckA